jgi:hypothetical protein
VIEFEKIVKISEKDSKTPPKTEEIFQKVLLREALSKKTTVS